MVRTTIKKGPHPKSGPVCFDIATPTEAMETTQTSTASGNKETHSGTGGGHGSGIGHLDADGSRTPTGPVPPSPTRSQALPPDSPLAEPSDETLNLAFAAVTPTGP